MWINNTVEHLLVELIISKQDTSSVIECVITQPENTARVRSLANRNVCFIDNSPTSVFFQR